jgi:hypothetical protein
MRDRGRALPMSSGGLPQAPVGRESIRRVPSPVATPTPHLNLMRWKTPPGKAAISLPATATAAEAAADQCEVLADLDLPEGTQISAELVTS